MSGKDVMRVELNLDKVLKQRKNRTYEYLCEQLNLTKDYDLINCLHDYFIKKIKNYNFESDVKNNKYLSKLERYFGYSLGKIDLSTEEMENVVTLLNDICDKIKLSIIKNIDNTSTNNAIENSILLLTISEELEDIAKKIIKKINYSNKIELIESYKIPDLLEIAVFDLKNIGIIEIILNNFSNSNLIKDLNNKLLFTKILEVHFNNLINKDDYYEKLYFDKVIDLWLQKIYISSENELETVFYSKISKFFEKLNKKDLDDNKKSYILSDIKERINQYEKIPYLDTIKVKENNYQPINVAFLKSLIDTDRIYKRKNLTKKHIITIDNPNAKILENAISIEIADNKYLLSLYITDVESFVNKDKIFARKTYEDILNTKSGQLFTRGYKYNNFSMRKGEEIPVVAYQFMVDEDFKILSFDIERATIVVKDNLTFNDFNNLDNLESEKTKNQISLLLELVYPYLEDSNKINSKTADNMNYIINNRLSKFLATYLHQKNLPLIYRLDNREDTNEVISSLEERLDINLNFLRQNSSFLDSRVYTAGADTIKNDKDINISIFSPARKMDAFTNQMLINTYLIDNCQLKEETKNSLEKKLDEIAESLNESKYTSVNNLDLNNKNIRQKIQRVYKK